MKKDSALYTVLFTFAVCAAFVFFLALASELTKDKVAANRRSAERTAVLRALGVSFASAERVDSVYDSSVQQFESGTTLFFRAKANGVVRYAKRFSGSALWGTVSGVIAVDEPVERIAGLEIVSHNETPGLGGRIDESWFKEQFRGERIGANGIRVRQGSGKGDGDKENGLLDAVTGASRTSAAMEKIVNAEIAAFRSARDAGGLK